MGINIKFATYRQTDFKYFGSWKLQQCSGQKAVEASVQYGSGELLVELFC